MTMSAKILVLAEVEPVGALGLKGFHRPVPAYNVLGVNLRRS